MKISTMFKLILMAVAVVACVRMCSRADAGEVGLKWSPSPTPGITNYAIYATTNSLPSNPTLTDVRNAMVVRVNVGTNLTARVYDLEPGIWRFVATAQKAILESDPSNVWIGEIPRPPASLMSVILQYSGTLTNFYDVGFFKLRIPDPQQ